MTKKEEGQLILIIKASDNSNVYFWYAVLLSIIILFNHVLSPCNESNKHDEFLIYIFSILSGIFLILCFLEINKSADRRKELKQHTKDGKTFDEAYELLFEEKESNAK